ncbi:MAG TPA: inosine/xanthosine triphosphatase [Patescibacteria group bacterium]|nr:inosine/xanthosine triphosphatase [Patescibacteria group bacterium]
MKVAVGSKNPVKIAAVKEAFVKVWPDREFEFIGTEVDSGVPDQPMSDNESIIGATNRALRAKSFVSADYGVGLEGGIQKIGEKYFDCGWIVVIDKKGQRGIDSSIRMEVPPKMMELIHQGTELGKVVDIVFRTNNAKHNQGHFGLMTGNAITRKEGYRDGVITALAAFINPDIFA